MSSEGIAVGERRIPEDWLERRFLREAAELALVAVAFLLYFIVRGQVVDRPEVAFANSRDLIALEQDLGIFREAAWQQAVLDSELLVRFWNFVYFWLDFPLIAALGLLMYLTRRRQYTFTRDAILFSGGIALIAYNLYPVAPPRLVEGIGVIDTLQAYDNLSYQAQSTQFFVNPFAAVPSLHVGWSFLIAGGVLMAYGRDRWMWPFALLHPVLQSASTIFTGNHFFLDGLAGLASAAFGVLLALAMQRWGYPAMRRLVARPK
ncbi:MAG TPA: phosphatase PAP2 family protein [Dehalococcoidia bacterium]|nr:phosphatase PAP2 family protein [Dehalococcoidia bacterium]